MRKTAGVLMLLVFFVPLAFGQKTRMGKELPKAKPGVEYPINVHISGVHIRSHCTGIRGPSSCIDVAYVDSVISGKKIELMGDWIWFPTFSSYPVAPGDYEARLLRDQPKTNFLPIGREYELVLSDQVLWHCTITGVSE